MTANAIERGSETLANPNPSLNAAQLAAAGIVIQPPGPKQMNGVFYTIDPNFKPQYSIQASLSVAREIGRDLSLEIGYQMYAASISNRIRKPIMFGTLRLRSIPLSDHFKYRNLGRRSVNPTILQNNQFASIGSSIYHGMTASLTKRYAHGLQFQTNYAFSRAIDNTSDYSSRSTPFSTRTSWLRTGPYRASTSRTTLWPMPYTLRSTPTRGASAGLAGGLGSFLIGGSVWGLTLSLAGTTGSSMNPARDLSSRMAHAILPIPGKGSSDWAYAPISVLGPVMGGRFGYPLSSHPNVAEAARKAHRECF